jgi:hypothetical protein
MSRLIEADFHCVMTVQHPMQRPSHAEVGLRTHDHQAANIVTSEFVLRGHAFIQNIR